MISRLFHALIPVLPLALLLWHQERAYAKQWEKEQQEMQQAGQEGWTEERAADEKSLPWK